MKKFGALHVVLASAGVAWPGMTLTSKDSLDMDRFEQVMKINVSGSAYAAKYGAVAMSKNKAVNDRGEKLSLIHI